MSLHRVKANPYHANTSVNFSELRSPPADIKTRASRLQEPCGREDRFIGLRYLYTSLYWTTVNWASHFIGPNEPGTEFPSLIFSGLSGHSLDNWATSDPVKCSFWVLENAEDHQTALDREFPTQADPSLNVFQDLLKCFFIQLSLVAWILNYVMYWNCSIRILVIFSEIQHQPFPHNFQNRVLRFNGPAALFGPVLAGPEVV